MTDLILHIGGHKTGTTYLQRMFHTNRARLREAGVIYPDLGPNDAHHALAAPWIDVGVPEGFFGEGGPDAFWQRFLDTHVGLEGTVVLSGENFSRARPRVVDMAELADRLAPFDTVRIVYTMRRQVEMVPAIWTQVAKNRRVLPLGPYLEKVMAERLGNGVPLDYGRVYDNVLKGFSPEQVVLLDYVQMRQAPGGIVGTFLRLAGAGDRITATDLKPLPPDLANISPDPLAMYLAGHVTGGTVPPEDMVQRIARVLKGDPPRPTTVLTRNEYARINDTFIRRNAELVKRVQPWQPGFTFLEAPAPENMLYRDDVVLQVWADLLAEFYTPSRPSPLHRGRAFGRAALHKLWGRTKI